MTKFNVLRTDYPMEVHAVTCKCKAMKNHECDWVIEGENVKEAVAKETKIMNSEFDSEYSSNEVFRIMPCCK